MVAMDTKDIEALLASILQTQQAILAILQDGIHLKPAKLSTNGTAPKPKPKKPAKVQKAKPSLPKKRDKIKRADMNRYPLV